jgi:membrane protease YdiL (CAAX protease family)
MRAIGLSSLIYLLYLLLLIPFAATRSAKRFNAPALPDQAPPARPLPSRLRTFVSTSIILAVLFALAWFTARSFSYNIFTVRRLGAREALAGASALAVCIAMIFVGRAIRTPEEIANLPVNRLMPHGPRETLAYSVMSIVAGVSEEAAYRGVLMQILWFALGNPWIAVFIAAAAFAVAHALQGWKSMLIIFVIACVMHALVWFTGTLVIAMIVHAAYDLAVPTIRRRISRERPTGPERIAG